MSNGDPPPESGAPYIIICSGRTDVGLATNDDAKVKAASVCAARFAALMSIQFGESDDFMSDLRPITTIQHELMNHAIGAHKLSHQEIDDRVNPTTGTLFEAMRTLEGEY